VIAEAVDRFGANPPRPDRDELALGTVVDLRTRASRQLSDQFGLFLGFTTTIVRHQDLREFPRLLRTVANQNSWQKRTHAAEASLLRMAAGLLEAKLHSPRRWAELYRQRMPIAAGVSNVNMNRDWPGRRHPSPVTDYYRVAPTGPMLPLIFTPTTLGDRLNFLITRQIEQITDDQLTRLAEFVSHRLERLAAAEAEWDS
ncbi:MAG: hypothetical protein NZ561_03425, partial [Phycisphaerae bacterium]|nr:hypothetical protein [Phycisphaerae bacterium]